DEKHVLSEGNSHTGRGSARTARESCAYGQRAEDVDRRRKRCNVRPDPHDERQTRRRMLRYCVKQGTNYALVAGKNVYTLEGHEAELDKYAAQKVTVKGTLKGETLTVESVLPAK